MTEGDQEQVIMTPKGKTANSTTLIIERKKVQKTNDKMHVAGGEHTGIIINKEAATGNILYYLITSEIYWIHSKRRSRKKNFLDFVRRYIV